METEVLVVAARISFVERGRSVRAAWLDSKVMGMGERVPVRRLLAAIRRRAGASVEEDSEGRFEIIVPARGNDGERFRVALSQAIANAGAKGAWAEGCRFPLEGPIHCELWDPRKKKLVTVPARDERLKGDYPFLQKQLRQDLELIELPGDAPVAVVPKCPQGHSVAKSARRCKACGHGFEGTWQILSRPKEGRKEVMLHPLAIELGAEPLRHDVYRTTTAGQCVELKRHFDRLGFQVRFESTGAKQDAALAAFREAHAFFARIGRLRGFPDGLSRWVPAIATTRYPCSCCPAPRLSAAQLELEQRAEALWRDMCASGEEQDFFDFLFWTQDGLPTLPHRDDRPEARADDIAAAVAAIAVPPRRLSTEAERRGVLLEGRWWLLPAYGSVCKRKEVLAAASPATAQAASLVAHFGGFLDASFVQALEKRVGAGPLDLRVPAATSLCAKAEQALRHHQPTRPNPTGASRSRRAAWRIHAQRQRTFPSHESVEGSLELVAQVRLGEIAPQFPDRLLQIFLSPEEPHVEVLRNARPEDARSYGTHGHLLSFQRLDETRSNPGDRYSKVGGHPVPVPNAEDEPDDGSWKCRACRSGKSTTLTLVDGPGIRVPGDDAVIHINVCTAPGCTRPSADGVYGTH